MTTTTKMTPALDCSNTNSIHPLRAISGKPWGSCPTGRCCVYRSQGVKSWRFHMVHSNGKDCLGELQHRAKIRANFRLMGTTLHCLHFIVAHSENNTCSLISLRSLPLERHDTRTGNTLSMFLKLSYLRKEIPCLSLKFPLILFGF